MPKKKNRSRNLNSVPHGPSNKNQHTEQLETAVYKAGRKTACLYLKNIVSE